MKRPLILLLALIMLGVAPGPRAADELAESEQQLKAVEKKLSAEKSRIRKYSRKETTVLGELQRINRSLVQKKRELKKVERSLARVRGDIKGTEKRITPLERERASIAERLEKRLRAMYMVRNGTALNVLFASGVQEPGAIARKGRYLTVLMESDSELIAEAEKNLTELRAERQRLVVLKAELESSKTLALKGKREAESVRRTKLALLKDVKSKKERSIRVSEELKEAAEELAALLERLREGGGGFGGSGFAAMKGRLSRPVSGRIVSRYGKVRHPKFKTVTFNNGIIIDAPTGIPVKSVYDGRVIFTGWLKGYGQLMILDNGGGYYTLYAHLDTILKERGEVVKKGDEIAVVGETGPQSTSGLYFEIRERGVPRDPMKWLASR